MPIGIYRCILDKEVVNVGQGLSRLAVRGLGRWLMGDP
jgi:hypothetical protein